MLPRFTEAVRQATDSDTKDQLKIDAQIDAQSGVCSGPSESRKDTQIDFDNAIQSL